MVISFFFLTGTTDLLIYGGYIVVLGKEFAELYHLVSFGLSETNNPQLMGPTLILNTRQMKKKPD